MPLRSDQGYVLRNLAEPKDQHGGVPEREMVDSPCSHVFEVLQR